MADICNSLKELSYQGQWDDVFTCLNLDANTTIELASLKIPTEHNDLWLDDYKATLNSLEVILGFILLCDQILYIILLLYLFLFILKFLRLHIFGKAKQWLSKVKKQKKYKTLNIK